MRANDSVVMPEAGKQLPGVTRSINIAALQPEYRKGRTEPLSRNECGSRVNRNQLSPIWQSAIHSRDLTRRYTVPKLQHESQQRNIKILCLCIKSQTSSPPPSS